MKPNNSGETGGFIQRMRGGTFNVGNQTLLQLIRFAYGLQGLQLVGAPDWLRTERFHITAKARKYLSPLIKGEDYPPYKDGLPQYVTLKNAPVKKKLKDPFVL